MSSRFRSKIRSFWRRWRPVRHQASVRVEFYTRAGCCLCDDALQKLAKVSRRYPFELQLIDIDQSTELQQQYGSMVPVVVVNGRERFHGRINEVLLDRLLSMESTQG
jgi:glutaredoxin